MALTVENGSGLPAAESYGTVAGWDAYARAHGGYSGEGDPDLQETYLRRATQWLDGTYGDRWKGQRLTAAQGLAWPRGNAWDVDGFAVGRTSIPRQLEHATYEVAQFLLEGGSLDQVPSAAAGAGRVKRTRDVMGPMSQEVEYDFTAGAAGAPRLSRVDGLLAPLLRSGGVRYLLRA